MIVKALLAASEVLCCKSSAEWFVHLTTFCQSGKSPIRSKTYKSRQRENLRKNHIIPSYGINERAGQVHLIYEYSCIMIQKRHIPSESSSLQDLHRLHSVQMSHYLAQLENSPSYELAKPNTFLSLPIESCINFQKARLYLILRGVGKLFTWNSVFWFVFNSRIFWIRLDCWCRGLGFEIYFVSLRIKIHLFWSLVTNS